MNRQEKYEWDQVQYMLPEIMSSKILTENFLIYSYQKWAKLWNPLNVSPPNLSEIDKHFMLKGKQNGR